MKNLLTREQQVIALELLDSFARLGGHYTFQGTNVIGQAIYAYTCAGCNEIYDCKPDCIQEKAKKFVAGKK